MLCLPMIRTLRTGSLSPNAIHSICMIADKSSGMTNEREGERAAKNKHYEFISFIDIYHVTEIIKNFAGTKISRHFFIRFVSR